MSSSTNAKKSTSNTPRWNLEVIPFILRKNVLNYLHAHRSYALKLLAQRKLQWRKANAFMPTHSKYRDGSQMVRVVNEEESQKKLFEKDMENKLLYIGQDVGTAKETMQKSLVTMMKQLNLHLRNVRQYVNEFANAEGQGDNMAMDDDVLLNQGDPWMEFGDEEREKMLRAIAHAREVTNNELNHAYDKWEEFQDKKSVARETRVQNDKVYAEIQKAKEYKNKDNDLNKLHDQVTSLTKALNCLMEKNLGQKTQVMQRKTVEAGAFPPMETNHEGTKKAREKTRTRTRGKGAASQPDRHPQGDQYRANLQGQRQQEHRKQRGPHEEKRESATRSTKRAQITSTKNENKGMEKEKKVNSCERAHEPIRSAW